MPSMRILMVHPGPDFSVSDVYRGWLLALQRQGHQVFSYNTNDLGRLSFYSTTYIPDWHRSDEAACPQCELPPMRRAMTDNQAMMAAMQGLSHELMEKWPRLVIFVSAFYTQAAHMEFMRARGFKIAIIHTESPYQDDEQLMRAQFANLNLLNDPSNLDDYKMLAPSIYMPHAYDPDIHYPRKPFEPVEEDIASDFAFIGTMFESRRRFFESMLRHPLFLDHHAVLGGAHWDDPHLDGSPLLKFLGHPRGECVDNTETARAYRNSRVGINFYRREAEGDHVGEGWSMGPREIEMAACGLPFARDPRPESDEIFPFLPAFEGPEDAADKLLWMLQHEDKRQQLAERARLAIADRTFDNHAAKFMQELEKVGVRLT